MNLWRLGIICFAILCVTVAFGIAFRKWIEPWLLERDDAKARKLDDARREAVEWKRRQTRVNGRTQRTGPPINRKAGGR